MGFQPSRYQEAIRTAVVEGRGNLFCDAKAGSGKTTTLVWAAKSVEGSGTMVCFNRSIKDEIAEKLREVRNFSASTIHSLGFKAVINVHHKTKVDAGKYRKMVWGLLDWVRESGELGGYGVQHLDIVEETNPWKDLRDLVNYARLTLAQPQDLEGMASHYGIETEPLLWQSMFYQRAVEMLLRRGRETASQSVDYTDMIWLPVVEPRVYRPKARYSWLFVDEAQDLSKCQLECVQKALRPGGRMLFVGDRNQAIYGFAGADTDSVDRIIRETDATELPLSICYRCGSDIIKDAQEIVPDIEAAPGAATGHVAHVTTGAMMASLKEGDLVLCRVTRYLVTLCYELIRQRIPATIKGRDIGQNLINLARKIVGPHNGRKAFGKLKQGFEHFEELAETWLDKRLSQLDEEDAMAADAVKDQVGALLVIHEMSEAKSLRELEGEIESLFQNGYASVCLSTVHRAKGLEADRVWILHPELMPHPMARLSWEHAQERNLEYVAITRAMRELYYIDEGDGEVLS